jgi:hypothetical protein
LLTRLHRENRLERQTILWATYLEGGEYQDFIAVICVDAAENVYVTGGTGSKTFPVMSGAWFTNFGSETFNGFIAKLSSKGSKLVFSTYLPGAQGTAIAVDRSNHVFVAGNAIGNTFPATNRAGDPVHGKRGEFSGPHYRAG